MSVKISLEALMSLMPKDARLSPAKQKLWIQNTINEIKQEYANLEPDDAFVHTDAVEVTGPVGAVDGRSIGGLEAVISVLERQSVRALKTMPIMMGLVDGSSEANGNRQWEIETTGIASLQGMAETMIAAQADLALRARGIAATCVHQFKVLRAAQALRDAQTKQFELENINTEYDRGFIGQDEASIAATGHLPDQPEPRVYPTTDQPAIGEDEQGDPSMTQTPNPEPGEGRGRLAYRGKGWRTFVGGRELAEAAR